ncbi:MAG: dienelactone hydrolase family protein [Bacteroidota bacterium]
MIRLILFTLTVLFSLDTEAQVAYWQQLLQDEGPEAFQQKIEALHPPNINHVLFEQLGELATDDTVSGANFWEKLHQWNAYQQPEQTGHIYQFQVQLDSNYKVPYLVYIPRNYNADKPNRLLVYYRGGWLNRTTIPQLYAQEMINENPFIQYADTANLILAFPVLERKLAIYGKYGYQHLRLMIKGIKKYFNIDDNAVYLSGFSDGGISTWFTASLVPSSFAAFYPINAGIAHIPSFPNYSNRSILCHLAGADSLVDAKNVQQIEVIAKRWNAKWTTKIIPQQGHYFPNYSSLVIPVILQNMQNTMRNPLPKSIEYHRNGNYKEFTGIDWIQFKHNNQKPKGKYHYQDSLSIFWSNGEPYSFLYGQKNGQISAEYETNVFRIKASMIDQLEVYLSPLMINPELAIKIYVNDKLVYQKKVSYDKEFMCKNFQNNFDRQRIWMNKITLDIQGN